MSVVSTSPATLFGETWVQLTDKFLIGAGGSYGVNVTGGETVHTLTAAELPSHGHRAINFWQEAFGSNRNITPTTVSGTGNLDGATWKAITVPLTGSDSAHNNMSPYLVVYMWKRIA